MIVIKRSDGVITVSGHAGYAPHGQDVVCAAVSTLTQAFIKSVEELTEDNLKCDIAAGNAVIRYGNLSRDAQLLINSFFVGLRMIADSYPEYVRIA